AVLKLAHHGSRNGTDARWLALVKPRLAVVSLGANNVFGHPHPQTLALLARRGIPLLRTDRDGTITVQSDGTTWEGTSHPHAIRGPPDTIARGNASSKSGRGAKVEPRDRPINVNTATLEELKSLPGIGPVLARRIVSGRPYASVEDLRRVEGIGRKRLA